MDRGSRGSVRLRFVPFVKLRARHSAVDHRELCCAIEDDLGNDAARGATEFGEYFLYFSFFLMVSALLLTGLFFRLGVEQRAFPR